jgi:hypothetical protein
MERKSLILPNLQVVAPNYKTSIDGPNYETTIDGGHLKTYFFFSGLKQKLTFDF